MKSANPAYVVQKELLDMEVEEMRERRSLLFAHGDWTDDSFGI